MILPWNPEIYGKKKEEKKNKKKMPGSLHEGALSIWSMGKELVIGVLTMKLLPTGLHIDIVETCKWQFSKD